jgi:hypothetical protein
MKELRAACAMYRARIWFGCAESDSETQRPSAL